MEDGVNIMVSGKDRLDASFWILCFLFSFSLFYRTSTAVIAEDLMRSFAISASSLGLMASTYFYSYAALQIPVGVLCDRIGIRYTVAGFGLLGVAGSVFFTLAPGVMEASLARLLIGAGTAGVWVPALKHLFTRYTAERFA